MKYLLVSVLTAVVVVLGCTSFKKKPEFGVFQSYVDSFKKAAKSQGVRPYLGSLTIVFVDGFKGPDKTIDYSGIIGLCMPGDIIHTPVIYISKPYWTRTNELRHEQLIWHEMGHCVLGRPHLMQIKDEHPISIMYPDTDVVNDEVWYLEHKQDFIEELFRTI